MKVDAAPGTYPHGTYAKYVLERCRCDECRVAVAAYRRQAAKLKAYGRGGNVDAGPARAHVLALMSTGMGYRRIGLAAGLNPNTIHYLLRGRSERGTPPPSSIRIATAKAILAVQPTITPGQTITGERVLQAWSMIADLLELGYSKAWIATQILGRPVAALQLSMNHMEARTIVKIARLHRLTPTGRKCSSRHEQAAATRAVHQGAKLRGPIAVRMAALRKRGGGDGSLPCIPVVPSGLASRLQGAPPQPH